MNYWFTTHWPLPKGAAPHPPSGVWAKDEHRHLIEEVAPGDLVLIYETKSGRTAKMRAASGQFERIVRGKGREGIVALVEVTDRAVPLEGAEEQEYEDGTTRWWRYRAETRPAGDAGFLPRVEVCKIMPYSQDYVFRGFGTQRSGLKRISPETFARLREAFLTYGRQSAGASSGG